LLPRGMSRRKNNTTFYAYRSKRFFWKLEWVFCPHGQTAEQNELVRLVNNRVEDTTPLQETLQALLDSIKATTNCGDSEFNRAERKEIRTRLGDLLSLESSQLALLMEKQNCPADQKEYYRFDPAATLASNLQGKMVLEFPSILVVPEVSLQQYVIVKDPTAPAPAPGVELTQPSS